MDMYRCSSTCLLALLLMFSVQGLAVVARVRLSSTQVVLMEHEEVCIDVINDEYGPETRDFTISYSYSTVLSGISGSSVRTDQLYFSSSSNRTPLCISHQDDTTPCEPSITGTITLTGSSSVDIGQPSSAQVIIDDDDFINASFVENLYTLVEGRSSNERPLISISQASTLQLEVLQESTNIKPGAQGRSLAFQTIPVSIVNAQEQSIMLDIQDDDIALEDPEEMVLLLSVPSQASCSNVNLSPLKSTRILLFDDDNVTVGLTSSSGTVAEGEGYEVCVTLSRRIARRLDVLLRIHSGTADLSDLALPMERNILTFTSHSESVKCIQLATIQDHVIESNESFQVKLSIVTVLPASLQHNLIRRISSSRITIQDTSICTKVFLDPLSTDSNIYVHKGRTLCFSCTTCPTEVSWNLTSYDGNKWAGKSGEHIHSGSSLPFRAEILDNGTLLILNSSLVFSEVHPGTLGFSSDAGNGAVYNVHLQEGLVLKELTISCTTIDERATLTCLYGGSPPLQITWFADSQPVSNKDITSEMVPEGDYYKSTLNVNTAMHSIYTCKASNSFGSKNSTINASRCHDINVHTSAINTSMAISSLSTAYYLISCMICLFLSHCT